MKFYEALQLVEQGKKLARRRWPKGRFIYLVRGQKIPYEVLRNEAKEALAFKRLNDGRTITIHSHIDMYMGDESVVVGWTPSQTDMLADDWYVVESTSLRYYHGE